jgi:phosphomannomutase
MLDASASSQDVKDRIRGLADLNKLAGDEVIGLNHRDGMKLKTAGGWVLVRQSGTEPLLRVYAEGETEGQSRAYIRAALQHLGLPGISPV